MTAKLKEIAAQLQQRTHDSIGDTLKWLQSVVRGYFQYHAIPGNWERLEEFRKTVLRVWHRSLRRRSHKSRWTWTRFRQLLVDQIPEVRILHPFPDVRFDAKHSREEPCALAAPARAVRGAVGTRCPYRDQG